MNDVKRKPEHVQRAREILALEYQDQLAIIGELLAEREELEDEHDEEGCKWCGHTHFYGGSCVKCGRDRVTGQHDPEFGPT